MRKSILIIDTPHHCYGDCDLCILLGSGKSYCSYSKKIISDNTFKNTIPSWCPLKPLPERKEINKTSRWEGRLPNYRCGWNNCLDSITGEKQMLNAEKIERNFKAGDIVKHFKREFLKGEYVELSSKYLYKIIGFAEHTETKEKVVVYQALYKEEKVT